MSTVLQSDQVKVCSKCDQTKPMADFYVKYKATGKLFAWCKTCHKTKQTKPRQKIMPGESRQCRRCNEVKLDSDFREGRWVCKACVAAFDTPEKGRVRSQRYEARHPTRRKEINKRYDERHPGRRAEISRNYREKNPDGAIAAVRKWQKANPEAHRLLAMRRRARRLAAEGNFTTAEWRELKRQYSYTCLMCRKREPEITLTPDHVVPLAKGGRNSIDNIQPLCRSCNSRKNDKIIDLRALSQAPLFGVT